VVALPERKQSERPLGREAFPGDAGSRALAVTSDDGLLSIVPHLPGVAIVAAVGEHEQSSAHAGFLFAAGQLQDNFIAGRFPVSQRLRAHWSADRKPLDELGSMR